MIGKIMPYLITYKFSQTFNTPAEKAYQRCTDFTPDDPALMAEDATRDIKKITKKTILLKESFNGEKEVVAKEKIVQLYPERLMWISTHLSGPNKYSQFIYEVAAETGSSSRLDFTAQHIEHQTGMSAKEILTLRDNLCEYDSNIWKRLAKAMAKELNL
jgi:hypothetical protein